MAALSEENSGGGQGNGQNCLHLHGSSTEENGGEWSRGGFTGLQNLPASNVNIIIIIIIILILLKELSNFHLFHCIDFPRGILGTPRSQVSTQRIALYQGEGD